MNTNPHASGIVEIALEQGSQEWKNWRRTLWMASDAKVAMGYFLRGNSTKQQRLLIDNRKGLITERTLSTVEDRLFKEGHRMEPEIRAAWNKSLNTKFYPTCYQRQEFGASLDGIDLSSNLWLEVKTTRDSNSTAFLLASQKNVATKQRIPNAYWSQLVHQAFCVPKSVTQVLYCITPQDESSEQVGFFIERDELLEDWPTLQAAWGKMTSLLQDETPPARATFSVKSYADDLKWITELKEARMQMQSAKEKEERALAALFAKGARLIPGVAEITEQTTPGKVSWKKVAQESGASEELIDSCRSEGSIKRDVKFLNV